MSLPLNRITISLQDPFDVPLSIDMQWKLLQGGRAEQIKKHCFEIFGLRNEVVINYYGDIPCLN